jgi:hypothetical protein
VTAKLATVPDATTAPEPTGLECRWEDLSPYRLLGPIRLDTDLLDSGEPWLDKEAIAEHFTCSKRTVENYMAEGMPHQRLDGRVKMRVSECTLWMRQTGHLSPGAAS